MKIYSSVNLFQLLLKGAVTLSAIGLLGCGGPPEDKPAGRSTLPDWENLEVLQRNREPAHSTFVPFREAEEVLDTSPEESPCYLSLNGTWKFHWSSGPAVRPEAFHGKEFDVSGWDDIRVPGNWELQGFGIPIYTDSDYLFPADPPRVPHEDNPVGSYHRTFELPLEWQGRRTFLHFAGVRSAMNVWVNGESVGYSQGSKTPAEFDITPHVEAGAVNTLAVEVYRFSDGSYLEDQDYWKISGIERDVYLVSAPQVRIRDFFAAAGLDTAYRDGVLSVDVEVVSHAPSAQGDYLLDLELFDGRADSVLRLGTRRLTITGESRVEASFRQDISNPQPWTAETPNLYTLVLSLRDSGGGNPRGRWLPVGLPQGGSHGRPAQGQRPARPPQGR